MRATTRLGAAALLLPWAAAASPDFDPAESYRMNCAPCHGSRGEGLDPATEHYRSFKSPPADLSDPLFNSREPAADWFLVTKHGGAKVGLSSQMPAFGGALTDEQIVAVIAHVKTLAATEKYPPGDLNFLRPVRTIKAFPEDELLLIHRHERGEGGSDARKNTIYLARRFGAQQQVEVKLSHLDDDERSQLQDVEIGYKWAFHHDLARSLLVAAGAEAEIPLHDDGEPTVYIPYFSLAHGLSSAFLFQTTARSHLPDDGIDGGDLELSGVVHWVPSPWRRSVSPALELVATTPFTGEADPEVTAIPQLYAGLSRRGHVALAIGIELPLTGLDYDYRVHGFLLWDFADGPFWEGW